MRVITILFAIGIALADTLRQYEAMPFFFAAVLVVALVFGLLFRHKEYTSVTFLYMATMALGGLVMSADWRQKDVCLPQDYVEYDAIVDSEPVQKRYEVWECDLVTTNLSREYRLKASIRYTRRLHVGDRLHCSSRWRLPKRYYFSDMFDYALYLKRHGYAATTFVDLEDDRYSQLLPLQEDNDIGRFFMRLRSDLLARIRPHESSSQDFALVAAMLLGDKSRLSQETKNEYAATGVAHVLALSGLHVSILISIVTLLLSGMGKKKRGCVTLVLLWGFAFLVGMPVSLLRVSLIFTMITIAQMIDRDTVPLNSLFAAALIILIFSPQSLYDIGFQLSFSAVFFIIVIMDIAQSRWYSAKVYRHRFLRTLIEVPMVSLAAQLGTLPLILYHFGTFPVYFLITNLFVGLFATRILSFGALSLCVSFSQVLLAYSQKVLFFITSWMNSYVHYISQLPCVTISDIYLTLPQVLLSYLIIFLLLLPFYWKKFAGFQEFY